MADSRFNAALKKINSFSHIPLSEEIAPAIDGAWSVVKFQKVKDVKLTIEHSTPTDTCVTELKIAISTLKPPKEIYKHEVRERLAEAAALNGIAYDESKEEEVKSPDPVTCKHYEEIAHTKKKDMFRSMRHLRDKHISTRFNLPYLGFNAQAQKISIMGIGDLHQFIVEKYKSNLLHFKLEFIQRIIGQMLLGVLDLHENDLVHRDVKLENFMVFHFDYNYFVKLGDHSEVMCPTFDKHRNSYITGTPDHFAPEMVECLKGNNVAKYNLLDWKALDCFALGMSFYLIFFQLFIVQEKDEDDPRIASIVQAVLTDNPFAIKLNSLIKCLLMANPKHRLTAESAKEHCFFGDTPAARQQFFDQLITEESEYHLSIDGVPQIPTYSLNSEDYKILLDPKVKALFTMAEKINAHLKDVKTENISPKQSTDTLTEQLQQLEVNPSKTVAQSSIDKFQLLEIELNEFINCLQQVIAQTQPAEDFVALREASIVERDKVIASCEKIRIETLKQAVISIVNQLSPTGMLSFFSATTESTQLKEFQAQFIAEVQTGASYQKLLDSISQFLGDKIPENSLKHKFNHNLTLQLGLTLNSLKSKLNVPDYIASPQTQQRSIRA
jgi:serine/threonine protein kinase